MPFKNTEKNYGSATKFLHWIIALIVIAELCLGVYMTSLPHGDPSAGQFYGLHKSIGVTILGLFVLRLLWRLYSPPPALLPTVQKMEAKAATLMQYFFYFALFVLPMSGWMLSTAAGHPVHFFHFFTLPSLVGKNHVLGEILDGIHVTCAYVLMGGIALHAAGAFKHFFVDKDKTLQRMLPFFSLPEKD